MYSDRIPDPQAEDTFMRSKLRWDELHTDPHRGVYAWYRAVLSLRASHAALNSRTALRELSCAFAVGMFLMHKDA